MSKYVGRVDHVSPHYAYVILERNPLKQDILVTSQHLKEARHNDKVEIQLLPKRKKQLEGKVCSLLERNETPLVGHLTSKNGAICFIPDHRRFYPMLVPTQYHRQIQENDKVVARPIGWSTTHQQPIAKVTRVLGKEGSYEAEQAAIEVQFQLSPHFDPAVEQMAAQLPDTLSSEEIASRRDFSGVTTFTIDPDSAKDFDDALSLRLLPNGHYEVGIHIADVTHYVKKNSSIDQEARKRGTSVYLVGTVIPMLPERLSNHLCSLVPEQKRPALSIVVTLDPQARVHKLWLGESIIFSNKRFTYQEAQEILTQKKKGRYHEELAILDALARKLRKKRIDHGAIAFETTDVEIELNERKEPIHIAPKQTIPTHQLIEEFMLLANRLVAERITRANNKKHNRQLSFIYRTHDDPKADKIDHFANFLRKMGVPFNTEPQQLAHSFNRVLKSTRNTPQEQMVQTLAIRTMEQARYTTKTSKHYGLGFSHYTHATSPIRRYPDIIVHRAIKAFLANKNFAESDLEQLAVHCSQRERIAVEAERASISYQQVRFLQRKEGKIFQGIISGITERNIYIEVMPFKCEGMARLADMKDDYYIFDPVRLLLRGKKTKRIYQIGGTVTVKIKQCNLQKKTIDLLIINT